MKWYEPDSYIIKGDEYEMNVKSINKNSRIPLYYQLMDILIAMIDEGNLLADDKIPSERELCEKYSISRSTVRQAIQELEKEGYVYKVQGKGTFISPEKFKQDLLEFYSFTEEMKKIGRTPSSKVLDFDLVNASEKIAEKMNLKAGARIYKFTRLRLSDDEPMMVETTYLPFKRFPELTCEELEENAMYDIFTEKYGIRFSSAEEIFQSVRTGEGESSLLDYPINLPSMMIERITYEDKNIIEYTRGIARGDRFKYHVSLEK